MTVFAYLLQFRSWSLISNYRVEAEMTPSRARPGGCSRCFTLTTAPWTRGIESTTSLPPTFILRRCDSALHSASAFNRFDHKRFESDTLLQGVSKCFQNVCFLNKFRSFFLHQKISHFQAVSSSIKAPKLTCSWIWLNPIFQYRNFIKFIGYRIKPFMGQTGWGHLLDS